MTKYILIPEFAPLHAMKRCFGPEHGPLKQPAKVPIDIIGMLLMQTGKEKVTIYEVKEIQSKKPNKKEFSEPIQLTIENYRLPYDEIIGIKNTEVVSMVNTDELPTHEPVVVAPVVVPSSPVDETENLVVETANESEDEKVVTMEEPIEEIRIDKPVSSDNVIEKADAETSVLKDETISHTENNNNNNQPNPYAGMTKAERRAARRAAALAAQQENEAKSENSIEESTDEEPSVEE